MGVLPIVFRRSTEEAIASYNFTDIAAGTGIIEFYAGTSYNPTINYRLSNLRFYSDDIAITATSTDALGIPVKQLDVDFDVLINKSFMAQGLAIVNIPVHWVSSASSTIYLVAKLRKYAGGAETEIASGQSWTMSYGSRMFAINFTVPQTTFKKGEYMRLTLEVWITNSTGSVSTYHIGTDPQGRTFGGEFTSDNPSTLIFYCPVRIDL